MAEEKSERRRRLLELLGELPQAAGPVHADVMETVEYDGFVLERLTLRLNEEEAAPAYYARPAGSTGKHPVIVFNHSHGGIHEIGKDELLLDTGKGYLQSPSYAAFLTSLGYSVLCFDAWGFGERSTRSESEIFKEMLWNGKVMWGMMVYDSIRAIDYLYTRDDVDTERIGTIGISMGGTMAWWLAALDERVGFCVDMCSLADYDALIATRSLDIHGIYYYVPSLLKHFTAGRINALVSPRPHLGFAGLRDPVVPAQGLDRIDSETRQAYLADGAADRWKLARSDSAHEETPEMRREIERFLLEQAK